MRSRDLEFFRLIHGVQDLLSSAAMRIQVLIGVAALTLAGCPDGGGGAAPSASASAAESAPPVVETVAPTSSAEVMAAIPIAPEKVAKVMNPKGEAPYAGKTGTLKGVVRIKGDPPPPTELKFPPSCGEAAATYGKLFRVGQGNAVADTMVTVTEYAGYVPPADEAKKITIHGCAFKKRTLVAAFGQRIEVYNLELLQSYMPFLDGADFRAVMVAIPGGDAVKIYAQQPGHYVLRDQLPHPFLEADVFILKYATHDVTDLDGQYEIKGIPVGKVRVDAFLPIIDETTGQTFEIKEGDNTLDLGLEFSKARWEKKKKPKPAPTGSAAAGPKG
jgi:hypothetical protein